jgi:hypothetical protein
MGRLEASIKNIFNIINNCIQFKDISRPTGRMIVLIFMLYVLFIILSNAGIAQQMGPSKIPTSIQDKYPIVNNGNSSSNIEDLKSHLSESQKKIGSDVLQLINNSFLMKGQSVEGIKNQMMGLRQIIPAQKVTTNTLGYKPSSDLVYVYVYLSPNASLDTITPFVYNVTNIDDDNHIAVAWVELSNMEALAALNCVKNIRTVLPPQVKMGSVTAQGDAILRTNLVRSQYGYTGSGIKIGVISDGVNNIAQSKATGDLPANVNVLSDRFTGDEGTAMLEIIYDMAPGAELYFHDYGNNELDFNNAIDDLVANGCTVIVDDIQYYHEPFFEDGIIASHINNLVSTRNIIYITSAGNEAEGHYQGTYYKDGSTSYSDFSHGISIYKRIFYDVPPGGQLTIVLQWNDKYGSSNNDYDLILYDDYGYYLTYSLNVQNGASDPFECIVWRNTYGYTMRVHATVDNYKMNAQTKTLELVTFGEGGYYDEGWNTNAVDSITGHASASNVITVGAISANNP